MKPRALVDIIWAVVAGGGTLAGIIVCARIQGSAQTPGMRIALIGLAVGLGLTGGMVLARVTARRRRRHRTGHSRRLRRHTRTVAFAIGGVIVACTIVALWLCEAIWLVVALGLTGLALTRLWYWLETLGLSSGAISLRHRRSSRSSRRDDRDSEHRDRPDEEEGKADEDHDVGDT